MAIIQNINVSSPNDGLGDSLRDSQVKANANFAELNTKKVEIVAGKDLSDNNYSDADKAKLDSMDLSAQVNVQADWNQADIDADDYIKNKPEEFLNAVGWFIYNDLATQTTPIPFVTGVDKKLTNDTAGVGTNSLYAPFGVSGVWNPTTNQLDFSQLSVGDIVNMRLLLETTTTSANQIYSIKVKSAIGSPIEDLTVIHNNSVKAAGSTKEAFSIQIVVSSDNIKNFPSEFYIGSDGNGTIKVKGFLFSIIRRNVNIIDFNTDALDSITEQFVYDNSTPAGITTNTTNGALTIKRGSAADTDSVLSVQNGAGVDTCKLLGDGSIKVFGTNTNSSGTSNAISVLRNINQSGTAGFRSIFASLFLQSMGSGFKNLIDLGVNSAADGSGTHTSKFFVDKDGNSGVANNLNIGISDIASARLQVSLNSSTSYPTLGTNPGSFFISGDKFSNTYGFYAGIISSNGNTWMQAMNNSAATAYNIVMQSAGGKVLVGTTSDNGTDIAQFNGSIFSRGLNLRNVANTFTSSVTNSNTAARTYTLPDKTGTVAMTSDVDLVLITITTSVSITTATTDANSVGQNGKHVVISNGANAINITCNGGVTSSYGKVGTGAITFVQGSGRTLVQLSGTAILNGIAGSTATLWSNGTTDYLTISNY